jgi:serine/threonine protein kinase
MNYEKLGASDEKIECIILKEAPHGELFDFIVVETFDEKLARSVAKDMLQGVNHIHNHRIAHRDIKP